MKISKFQERLDINKSDFIKVLGYNNATSLLKYEELLDFVTVKNTNVIGNLKFIFNIDKLSQISDDEYIEENFKEIYKRSHFLLKRVQKEDEISKLEFEKQMELLYIKDKIDDILLNSSEDDFNGLSIVVRMLLANKDHRINYFVRYLGKMNNKVEIESYDEEKEIQKEFETLFFSILSDKYRPLMLESFNKDERYKDFLIRAEVRSEILKEEL